MTPREHSPYFYTDTSTIVQERVVLEGEDADHLRRARRARPGDSIRVSDGRGLVLQVALTEVGEDSVAGEVVGREQTPRPRPQLVVHQGLAKGEKPDFVIRKLVEIGVDAIHMVATERSIPRWPEGPVDLPQAARHLEGLVIVAWEETTARMGSVLPEDPPERVTLVIGPEGGLGAAEVEDYTKRGGIPVTLGPQILQTETAALVAATLVMYRYQRIG